ncbi:MAG: hypothetical protein ACI9ON_001102, partial [Limisphaerales bacterium]
AQAKRLVFFLRAAWVKAQCLNPDQTPYAIP